MGMFALRIPDKMKKEMDRVNINWSDYLRHSIEEAIESEKKRTLIQKIRTLMAGQKSARSGTAAAITRHIRDHA